MRRCSSGEGRKRISGRRDPGIITQCCSTFLACSRPWVPSPAPQKGRKKREKEKKERRKEEKKERKKEGKEGGKAREEKGGRERQEKKE
jgi:hypothetical protein